jgi:hypothetical protein
MLTYADVSGAVSPRVLSARAKARCGTAHGEEGWGGGVTLEGLTVGAAINIKTSTSDSAPPPGVPQRKACAASKACRGVEEEYAETVRRAVAGIYVC